MMLYLGKSCPSSKGTEDERIPSSSFVFVALVFPRSSSFDGTASTTSRHRSSNIESFCYRRRFLGYSKSWQVSSEDVFKHDCFAQRKERNAFDTTTRRDQLRNASLTPGRCFDTRSVAGFVFVSVDEASMAVAETVASRRPIACTR